MNPTAVKEAIKNNFPINKLVGVWWAGGDDDARAGGPEAKGYKSLNLTCGRHQFPGHPGHPEVTWSTRARVLAPKEKVGENLYNRGVYNSMLLVEAHPQRAADHRQEGHHGRGYAPWPRSR